MIVKALHQQTRPENSKWQLPKCLKRRSKNLARKVVETVQGVISARSSFNGLSFKGLKVSELKSYHQKAVHHEVDAEKLNKHAEVRINFPSYCTAN